MKTPRITKILSTFLAAVLCITPEMVSAAQQNAQPPTQPQANNAAGDPGAQSDQNQQPAQPNRGSKVDPSQAPLQPVTTYPDAPAPQQPQEQTVQQPVTTNTDNQPAQQTQKPAPEPLGAAAAERVETAGGAASKPAGAAIAPAKQHQMRSLLLKIGAIAAGGLAAGTIYALTRSTPSKPPGAGVPGTTQK